MNTMGRGFRTAASMLEHERLLSYTYNVRDHHRCVYQIFVTNTSNGGCSHGAPLAHSVVNAGVNRPPFSMVGLELCGLGMSCSHA